MVSVEAKLCTDCSVGGVELTVVFKYDLLTLSAHAPEGYSGNLSICQHQISAIAWF